jgi:L-asparaginase
MDLIDSSNMYPGYWIKIAKRISDDYNGFDGFVVLHGTDTMAYTASALSFLLENLDKPVVVTGSQLPLAQARTDAAQNLVTALKVAASDGVEVIPEVCIVFDKNLLRGNRCRKVSSTGFDGFDSPNLAPLAEFGEHIKVDKSLVRKASGDGFYIHDHLEENVVLLDIFPGISPKILRSVFNIDGLKGVILRTYGTGNAPTTPEFLVEIEYAVSKKGLAVVNITQCNQGMVEMGLYEASSQLVKLGVISGLDMTSETALVKMMFLLGQWYDIATVKEQMQRSLRGEQSYGVFNFLYDNGATKDHVTALTQQQFPAGFNKEMVTNAVIRFNGIADTPLGEVSPELIVYMNYPRVSLETPQNIPQCLGTAKRDSDYVLRCTDKVKQIANPSLPMTLTVISRYGDISWDNVVFSIYTDVD